MSSCNELPIVMPLAQYLQTLYIKESDVYKNYEQLCEQHQRTPMSKEEFFRYISRYTMKITDKNDTYYCFYDEVSTQHLQSRAIGSHLYVLSSPSIHRYKIGVHTGSINELIDRYITYIPDVSIDLFVENSQYLEHHVHKILDEYRVRNVRDNKCEWFTCSLDLIKRAIYMAVPTAAGVTKAYQHNDDKIIPMKQYPSESHLNAAFEADTRNKFVVSTNAKIAIKLAQVELDRGRNVLLQIGQDKMDTAMSSGIPENNVQDPNSRLWSMYDTVIITPAVLNGISFVKDHFDTLYIYATKDGCDPFDIIQMSYRSRIFRDGDIHYNLVNGLDNKLPTSIPEFDKHMNMAVSTFSDEDECNVPHLITVWQQASLDLKFILAYAIVRNTVGKKYMGYVMDHILSNVMGYQLVESEDDNKTSLKDIHRFYVDMYEAGIVRSFEGRHPEIAGATSLYKMYKEWCTEHGYIAGTDKFFFNNSKEFTIKKMTKTGTHYYASDKLIEICKYEDMKIESSITYEMIVEGERIYTEVSTSPDMYATYIISDNNIDDSLCNDRSEVPHGPESEDIVSIVHTEDIVHYPSSSGEPQEIIDIIKTLMRLHNVTIEMLV